FAKFGSSSATGARWRHRRGTGMTSELSWDGRLLLLHQRLESIDRLVPLVGDLVQVAARLGQALRLELVNLRPTLASAAYKPGVFQSVQMLGDRLARDARPLAEANDGLRPAGTQPGDDAQPRAIAERRKRWRGLGEVACGGIARSGHRRWNLLICLPLPRGTFR